jgi:hypothetical protein
VIDPFGYDLPGATYPRPSRMRLRNPALNESDQAPVEADVAAGFAAVLPEPLPAAVLPEPLPVADPVPELPLELVDSDLVEVVVLEDVELSEPLLRESVR